MIGPAILETSSDRACICTVGVHHPDRRWAAGWRSTECDLATIRRFDGTEVPNRRVAVGERDYLAVCRIQPADFRPTAGKLRFVVAVEMVDVGPLRLKLPSGPRIWQATWKEDAAVARPSRQVRSAAARLRVSISCREPHGLAFGQHAVLGAVGPADAHVGPFVVRIFLIGAIDVKDPFSVRRPARAKVEMRRLCRDPETVFALEVASPDLIPFPAGEVE